MTVNLTRIYTRLGDGGETHLGDMSRVPKTHPRIEAYGTVDELNAQLGVALTVAGLPERYADWLRRVQNDLFDVGADISVPHGGDRERLRVAPEQTEWLEHACDEVNADARAAEVLRAARRHARRRAPARLPHGLPPRRAPHDRLRRRRQPRVRALPQPPLGPAVHPLARRQRAATSRCGSRGGTAEPTTGCTAPSTARCASCTPPARQLGGHWWRLGDRLGGAPADAAAATAPRSPARLVAELAKQTAERGLHGFPAAQGVGARLAGLRNTRRRPRARAQPGAAPRGARRRARRDAARATSPRSPTRGDDARSPPSTAAGRDEIARGARRRPRRRDRARRRPRGRDPPRRGLARSAAPATAPPTRSARSARRSTARRSAAPRARSRGH